MGPQLILMVLSGVVCMILVKSEYFDASAQKIIALRSCHRVK